MIARAVAKYIRISPYKVRRIANELRGKRVIDAESYLTVLPNKGAEALKKALHSARTNYLNQDKNADEEQLIISKILIDAGTQMKRFHPISRGRASKILKRSCHISVEVTNIEGA
jgi:large subunit ribosomal protein L22